VGIGDAEQNLASLSYSLDLLRLMPEISCGRFLAVGTCFEYDLSAGCISEATPLMPREVYGTSKKALFEVAQHFSAITGVSVVTPRVFYSYGPFDHTRKLVPSITLSLLRGQAAQVTPGEQVRDYLHVEDVASAIWRVATSDVTGAVNIVSAKPVAVRDVAIGIGNLLGRPDLIHLGAIPYRPDEPMRITADGTLLHERLGWSPKFDLDRGLAETVGWFEAQFKQTRAGQRT
jgi:nucleoside-diphosphate-sugar epimerase